MNHRPPRRRNPALLDRNAGLHPVNVSHLLNMVWPKPSTANLIAHSAFRRES